jgi:hypothetical protein
MSILMYTFPQFSYNLGSGEVALQYNATRVDDGLWHRIRATRQGAQPSLAGPGWSGRPP